MDNLQVRNFCNGGLRPTMISLVEAYDKAESLLRDYDATGLSSVLNDKYDDIILDGHEVDGRPPVSSGGVKLAMENIRALLEQLNGIDPKTGLSMITGARAISPRY